LTGLHNGAIFLKILSTLARYSCSGITF